MVQVEESVSRTDLPAPAWRALLIGGMSGTGKSIAAERLARHFGYTWLQVDLFRLAFQHSRATLPHGNDDLYLFWDMPDVWQLPPERLRDGLIGTGAAMSPAVEIVTASQIDHAGPAIIEGDNIVPSLGTYPLVRERIAGGQVAMVFLVEPDEEVLLGNLLARGRGMAGRTAAEGRTEARAKWLLGQWLVAEAGHYGLPVLESRPWETLAERIVRATG
jgi:2-phosphoglycerate kinase